MENSIKIQSVVDSFHYYSGAVSTPALVAPFPIPQNNLVRVSGVGQISYEYVSSSSPNMCKD